MNKPTFIHSFLARKGQYMLFASVVSKALSFLAVMLVTRQVTEAAFGAFSYAQNLVNAALPLMGMGAYQAFVRFASDVAGIEERRALHHYALVAGWWMSGLLAILMVVAAEVICADVPAAVVSFRVLALSFITTLVMEQFKALNRSLHKNEHSAWIDISYALWLLLLGAVFTSFWGVIGWAWAIVAAPLLAAIPWMAKYGVASSSRTTHTDRSAFWRYAVYSAVGAVLGQVFYSIDYLQMGRWLHQAEAQLALYRVSSFIPLATLAIPITIAATDFVHNAERKSKPDELKRYVKGYMRTMRWLVPLVVLPLFVLAPWLLGLFGEGYGDDASVMRIFLGGIVGAFVLRVPFGNLLSAVGKAGWNTAINAIVMVVTFIGCEYAVPRWGIHGAASVMATMLWLSGIANAAAFYVYCGSSEARSSLRP